MRILSWNLGHQTRERPIPSALVTVVKALKADVLVLNEYVHAESRLKMIAELHTIGLTAHNLSKHIFRQNQVLIASRSSQSIGDLNAPATTDAARANFLHVILEDIEIVGMRAPMFKTAALREKYWKEMEKLIESTKERRIIFIGDMNCDPECPSKPGGSVLNRLRDSGWKIPTPDGKWSFISKNGEKTACIDHAICSPQIQKPSAAYHTCIDDLVIAGSHAQKAMSDHAALVLEFGE